MSENNNEDQNAPQRDSGRPAWKKNDAQGSDKPASRPARSERPARDSRDERPYRGRDERPTRGRDDRDSRAPRGDRPNRPSRDGERDARPSRDSGSGEPPRLRFGNSSDRPARPPRDGERPARPARDGERPFRPSRDGDRPSRPPRDGERPFRPARDGDRPARPARDGDRPFRPSRDGDRPTRGFRDDRGSRDERGSRDDRGPRTGGRFERPGRAGEGRPGQDRPAWQQRVDRERDPNRAKSPMIPEEITDKDLDLLVRVQFKTLSPENSERVARHLAMVNLLINDDPELAHQHAIAAADRAGRIGVVRETLGLTAYTVGDFALALREMQAYRRISGKDDQLPIMVDCERGLGRPDKALELGRSVDPKTLEPGVRVNLAIALSGARLDRGENELALAELEIAELNPEKVFDYSPQLFFAYADTLEILGRTAESKRWANLGDRAAVALAQKNAPAVEVQDIIEEIEIPAPYESRNPRVDYRDSRFEREAEAAPEVDAPEAEDYLGTDE